MHSFRSFGVLSTALNAACLSLSALQAAAGPPPDVCATGCRYPTIQAAIDQARPGAIIRIDQGVYRENLALVDKSVTLQMTRVSLADLSIVGGHPDTFPSIDHVGGGISNIGCTLTIDRSEISGNQAFDAGGGILSSGPLLIRDSVIANNRGSNGGGLSLSASTSISRTLIQGNAAAGEIELAGGGGVLCNGASLYIEDSDIIGNGTSISQYRGGGILSGCTLWVVRTRIAGNVGMGLVTSGAAQIVDSVVSDNSVVGTVPISSPVTPYAVLGGYVGGILNYGTLIVTGTRVANNSGGGISNYGSLTVARSVIFHNDGRYQGDNGFGGGLYNVGSATLDTVTVIGNVADSGGGVWNGSAATIAIKHSSISGNVPDNCAGSGITCP
jgi:fibronectin-binding autotransporter adhesin